MTDGKGEPRFSCAVGCLFAVLCGIVGSVLGRYWGVHVDMQEAARMRANGETVDFLPVMPLIGILFGGCLGAPCGLLLAVLLRRKSPTNTT